MAAVFVEVEGVLIAPPGPDTVLDEISLLPGVASSLARFRLRGVSVVAVTDAPLTVALFPLLGERLKRLVADQGGDLAAVYAATPAAPASWRKPRPGMLLAAGREHAIELSQSWLVGRSDADAQAAGQAGCAGCVLVQRSEPPAQDYGIMVALAQDLADAPRVMIPREGGCWHQ
jgi:D-glycero-D-manno-heptose 1,7-bisphosphate phosphatase